MSKSNSYHPTTLFITRKYPPATGGMEHFMHGLIRNYPGKKFVIAYGGAQKWLPFVYIWQFFNALGYLLSQNIDLIHVGDGVMTPMGYLLKILSGKPVTYTAYGKDINLNSALYQFLIPPFLRRLDHVFPISTATRELCRDIGIEDADMTLVTPGVDIDAFRFKEFDDSIREEMAGKYGLPLDRKWILTSGRLSERKGVRWFVENAMEKLQDEYIYIVIGKDGTDISDFMSFLGIRKINLTEKINSSIKNLALEDSVYLLGRLPFEDLQKFYKAVDVFVTPNIPVEGDMEGFGIVNIEAGLAGTPVVGSDLEGISDAVLNGETGVLVDSGDPQQFIDSIRDVTSAASHYRPDMVAALVEKHFAWEKLSARYYSTFTDLLGLRGSKRSLYVFPFFTGPFGAERLLLNLINGVAEAANGFKPVLYTLYIDPASREKLDSRVKVKTLWKSGRWVSKASVSTFLSPVILWIYIFTVRPRGEMVHLLNWQSLHLAKLFNRRGQKVVYHCTEPPRFIYDLYDEIVASKGFLFSLLMAPYIWFIKRRDQTNIRYVDEIVSISEWTQSEVERIYGSESTIIYPAVEVERFDRVGSQVEARKDLGVSDKGKLYLTVSKIHPRKKILDSIDLFQKHSKSDADRYYIIGSGPWVGQMQSKLDEISDPRIEYLGRIESDDEVAQYMVGADFFIFTAKNEPFGIAPLEAKYAGCEILGNKLKYPILNTEQLTSEFIKVYVDLSS